jgi:prolyl 4-hydroxylase
MENVITPEEADRLIELGAELGYKRSSDVGGVMLPDGRFVEHISMDRTSTNAWCVGPCYEDALVQGVNKRLSELTGINETNAEHLQLLRYEPGQYYRTHNDYIDHNINRQQGVRILTVFLYLNDVEEGGETKFDIIKKAVMPKRGRAVLWPSVLNMSPHEKDHRTLHQARPVVAGIKYAANAWVRYFIFVFFRSKLSY